MVGCFRPQITLALLSHDLDRVVVDGAHFPASDGWFVAGNSMVFLSRHATHGADA
jgi:hypothetical protein